MALNNLVHAILRRDPSKVLVDLGVATSLIDGLTHLLCFTDLSGQLIDWFTWFAVVIGLIDWLIDLLHWFVCLGDWLIDWLIVHCAYTVHWPCIFSETESVVGRDRLPSASVGFPARQSAHIRNGPSVDHVSVREVDLQLAWEQNAPSSSLYLPQTLPVIGNHGRLEAVDRLSHSSLSRLINSGKEKNSSVLLVHVFPPCGVISLARLNHAITAQLTYIRLILYSFSNYQFYFPNSSLFMIFSILRNDKCTYVARIFVV